VVADGAGSWVAPTIYLVPSGRQPEEGGVVCGSVTAVLPNVVTCVLGFPLPAAATSRVVAQVWVAHAGTGGGAPQLLNASIILVPPPSVALAPGGGIGVTPRTAGSGRILLRLPVPRVTAADWLAAGLTPPAQAFIDALAVRLNGVPCVSPAWETATTLSCTATAAVAGAPADVVVVVVSLAGGAYNVTGAVRSLLRPLPALAVNTDVQLAPSSSSTATNLTLAGLALCSSGVLAVASASVAGVPCAAVACTPAGAALLCVGWNGSAAAGVLRGRLQAVVNASVVWVAPPASTATCDACVTLVARPVLASITPTSIAASGTPVVIAGTGMLAPANWNHPPGVLIGGEACGDVVALSPTVVRCTAPAVLASAPGFPVVSVVVVNAAGGNSTEPLTLTYPATFGVSWVSASPLTTLPGGALAPALSLRLLSRDAATCTVAITPAPCVNSNPALAARPGGMTVSVPATALGVGASGTAFAIANNLLLDALVVTGGSNCTGTLTASCIDASGLTASTAGQSNPAVSLSAWRADWHNADLPSPLVVVPGELPVLTATVALAGADGSLPGASAANLSCFALLAPASSAPPALNVSLERVASRDVLSTVTGAVTAVNTTAAAVAFTGVTAVAARLGQALVLYAECTWALTGERARLPPLPVATALVQLGWVGDDGVPPSGTVLGYSAVSLGLVATIVRPASAPSGSSAADARCALALLNSTSRGASVVADEWTLPLDAAASAGSQARVLVTATLQSPSASTSWLVAACTVWGQELTTPPRRLTTLTLAVQAVSALPEYFIASDASSPWPVTPQLEVAMVASDASDGGGWQQNVAGITCSVTTSTPAAELKLVGSDAAAASLTSIAAHPGTGVVAVPSFIVQVPPSTPALTLVIECRRGGAGDTPPAPLTLLIPAVRLATQLCTQPATQSAVSVALPAFAVGIVATLPDGTATAPCAATPATASPLALPSILCTIALDAAATTANSTADVFLQQVVATMAAASHRALFDAFTLAAPQGQVYGLSLTCAVGGLAIPPSLSFNVTLQGCRPGQASELVNCVTCGGGEFSLGGIGARCTGCPPAGAVCNAGILTLLPRYYRPPVQAGQPLGPTTELHPCYNAEACTLAFSGNASGATYGCSPGYTGPLCGVCDADANYARFGDTCSVCGNIAASWVFLLAIVLVVLAVLTRVALRKESSGSDASVVLRITLGFLQAVGSLRVFRAGSTQAYADVMGWTEVVSASPLSVGALQCLLRLPYLVQYIATVALPVLASVAVVAIFHGVTTARSVRCTPRCGVDILKLRSAVASWWSSNGHLSALRFGLFLSYMPIGSASLRALDCIAPVAGTQYLRSDLRVECGVGQHAAARVRAYAVLVILGGGFPAGLAWLMGTARIEQLVDPGFHATWGFLFDGYRAPTRSLTITAAAPPPTDAQKPAGALSIGGSDGDGDGGSKLSTRRRSSILPDRLQQAWVVSGDSRVWWEGVVLGRKAGVVLLAVTVTNPYLQCVGATLWFLAAFVLQVRYAPYANPLFNRLETTSLMATLLTAIISSALLQFNVGVATAELHSAEYMSGIEWAVTVLLAVLNLGTFAALAGLWLRLQCARARGFLGSYRARDALVSALAGRVRTSAAAPAADDGEGDHAAAPATYTANPLRARARAAATPVPVPVVQELATLSSAPSGGAGSPRAHLRSVFVALPTRTSASAAASS